MIRIALALSMIIAAVASAAAQTSPKPVPANEPARFDGSINAAGKLHPVAEAGLVWLLSQQQADGGFSPVRKAAGGVGGLIPGAVNLGAGADFSTSAIAGLALVRAGVSPVEGEHKEALRKTIAFVAKESLAERGVRTSQPDFKLGPLASPSHSTQFLSRVLPMLPEDDPLRKDILTSLEKTIEKLETADHAFLKSFGKAADGSFSTTPLGPIDAKAPASFSPVHHVLIALTALETAQAAGLEVNPAVLEKLRWMLGNLVDPRNGKVDQSKIMSIELYAFSSTMRSTAVDCRVLADLAGNGRKPRPSGMTPAIARKLNNKQAVAELTASAAVQQSMIQRLARGEAWLLQGLGTFGGEESLSYWLISEALVLDADARSYETWKAGLATRLARSQNSDGSFTGLHCITDSVYSTATAVLSLTAERDEPLLAEIARHRAEGLLKTPASK